MQTFTTYLKKIGKIPVFNLKFLLYSSIFLLFLSTGTAQVVTTTAITTTDSTNTTDTTTEIACAAVGGTITGGPFNFCLSDGSSDRILDGEIAITGNSGTNRIWVITDESGFILGLTRNNNINFNVPRAGNYLVWHLSYENSINGLRIGRNANDLTGCFALSNPLTVTKTDISGGRLTGGPFNFCVRDSVADVITPAQLSIANNSGANNQWVITNEQGTIVGLPTVLSEFDFDESLAGTQIIWHVSYDGNLVGLELGKNAYALEGCLGMSNPIPVINNTSGRTCGTPVACDAAGGTITGGPFNFCSSDGFSNEVRTNEFALVGNSGRNSTWVVTDENGIILNLTRSSSINFAFYGTGTYLIWHLAYENGLNGLRPGRSANDLEGCFSLSNPVTVNKTAILGGVLTGGPFSFCVRDSVADIITPAELSIADNSGTNNQLVITNSQGTILSLPTSISDVDFDEGAVGTEIIWHVSYQDSLVGLEIGKSTYALRGCFGVSNPIAVRRSITGGACGAVACTAAGGTITGGPFDFCAGDGISDNIAVDELTLAGNTGSNSIWLVTNQDGTILSLARTSSINFNFYRTGTYLVWHLSYDARINGLRIGSNANNLEGCFNLSNSVTVNKTAISGGRLSGGPFNFCIGDGVADIITAEQISLSNNSGANNQWIITDEQGIITGLPTALSGFNFDEGAIGTQIIRNVSYEDSIVGLTLGESAYTLQGCFGVSNAIAVRRNASGEACGTPVLCEAVGGVITGGPFSFCAGDGISDRIAADELTLAGNAGTNSLWLVTNEGGIILGLARNSSINFSFYGAGTYLVWHLSYENRLNGLRVGNNANDLQGCFDLSNPVTVNKTAVSGGRITGGPFIFCVRDSIADVITSEEISLINNSGTNSQWVITDEQGTITGLPTVLSDFNFEGAAAGTQVIWHVSYDGELAGLAVGESAYALRGCFGISNAIPVRINTSGETCGTPVLCEAAGGIIEGGPFSFCAGDGVSDRIAIDEITLTGNSGRNSAWLITDENGTILGLNNTSALRFDFARTGTYLVWHLAYENGINGLRIGRNANDLQGCFNLSNSITINKTAISGGILSGSPVSFCVQDSIADIIDPSAIALTGHSGENNQWMIVDNRGIIVALPATFSDFNFEDRAAGTHYVRHVSYQDSLAGLEIGRSIYDFRGCFGVSNSIVIRSIQGGIICGIAPAPCSAPTEPLVSFSNGFQVILDWEAVPSAITYIVQIRLQGDSTWIDASFRRPSARIKAWLDGTFEYRLKTICNNGESDYGPIYNFSTSGFTSAESRSKGRFEADIVLEKPVANALTIAPNPFSDRLQVTYEAVAKNTILSIYDISGKQIKTQVLSVGDVIHTINTANMEQGYYLLSIQEKGKAAVNKRIIKQATR